MPPITQQIEKINESVANINQATGSQSLDTISTETLQPQGEFTLPKTAPTEVPEMGAAETVLATTGDSFIQEFEDRATAQREAAAVQRGESLQDLIQTMGEQKGMEGFLAEEEEKRDIVGLSTEVRSQQAIIQSERLARANQRAKLEGEGGGLKIGAQAEFQNFARDSLFKETNAVIQLGVASGRLSDAKAAAQRVAEAFYRQEQNILNIRREIYNENKELFNTADQRSFDIEFDKRQRQLDAEQDYLEDLQNAKIEAIRMAQVNGAPPEILDTINKAETPEEVFNNAGQFGSVDLLERSIKQEQLEKLRKKPEALRQTKVIDQGGRKLLIDSQTGDLIKDFGISSGDAEELQKQIEIQGVKQVDDLRAHKGLNSSVGPTFLQRIAVTDIAGAKDDFIAGVDNLTKDLTLDNLIKAKEEGATFGALSNAELQLLAESATKINNWRKGERGPDGAIIETSGYDASEKDFKSELDRIAYYRVLDARKKGATPDELGLASTPDGKIWFKNSDGSVTELK